jgi:hypothetical protein
MHDLTDDDRARLERVADDFEIAEREITTDALGHGGAAFLRSLAQQSPEEGPWDFTTEETALLIARLARGKSVLPWRAAEEEVVVEKLLRSCTPPSRPLAQQSSEDQGLRELLKAIARCKSTCGQMDQDMSSLTFDRLGMRAFNDLYALADRLSGAAAGTSWGTTKGGVTFHSRGLSEMSEESRVALESVVDHAAAALSDSTHDKQED